MTLSVLEVLWLLGAPLVAGFGMLRLLGLSFATDRLAFAAWSYLVGTLSAAVSLWLWTLTAKPFPVGVLWSALGVFGVVAVVAARRHGGSEAAVQVSGGLRAERLLFLAVVALLLLHGLDVATARNALPILAGDEGNIWTAKAKVLHVAIDSIGPAFREEASLFVQHPDYPLLNPLLQLGVFEIAGRLTAADSRLPIQAVMLALIVLTASSLRRHVRPAVAAAMLLALFTTDMSRFLTGSAYADHLVMFGTLAAVDAWSRFRESRNPVWFRLACVGMAFAILAKNEGSMLCLMLVTVIGSLRALRALRAPVLPTSWGERAWLALPVSSVLGVQLHNAALAFRNDLFDPDVEASGLSGRLIAQFDRHVGPVLDFAWREIVASPSTTHLVFGGLFIGLGMIALVPTRRPRAEFLVPTLSTLGALAVYQLVFVATPYEIDKHLPAASVRVAMHVAPLSLIAQAMLWGDLFPMLRGRDQSGSR